VLLPLGSKPFAVPDRNPDMAEPPALPAPTAGAGVLDLLRQFKQDGATADSYAAQCLARAREVEPRLKAFEYLPTDIMRRSGPLSGIPVAIKDIIATSDMPTTNGSPIYRDHVPAADAWVVERLRNLGATIFGKTVSTEFAWRHPGPTVNPWNVAHTPGGSSSGSAAAVAAGLVPLALGTQTLGSVIRPAAFNGVVGFKPSYGAIPRVGVHPLSPSLDHIGFFARRVDDVALALSLLSGASDADPHGRPLPSFEIDVARGVAALDRPRLAVVRFGKWERAEPEQQNLFNTVVEKLRSGGAVVEERELAELDAVNWDAINTIMLSEATVIFSDLIARYPDRVSEVMKSHVETGRGKTAMDYLAAKRAQDWLRAALSTELDGVDAVLTLPAFGEAPHGLAWTGDAEYCAPWTFLGAPAVALPAGFGRNGLPLGVQVAGRYRDDLRLLRTAKWVEATLGFDPGVPPVMSP
jgi:Asp-tRNA(Asn)/Glu-tRNA(Gln) amidotransferase A subunit family amidase